MNDANNLKYKMVSTAKGLQKVLKACGRHRATALDFETTSLRPADGRARLVSLCNDKVRCVVDFDGIDGGFRSVAHLFKDINWVCFNNGFEGRWFLDAGSVPTLWDVGYLRRAILGGGRFRLAQIALWDLDEPLDKEEQVSDWGAPKLTKSQLDYSFKDADITWRLWRYWGAQADAGRWAGFHMLNDMYLGVIEMEDTGMLLDTKQHGDLVADWLTVRNAKRDQIRTMVDPTEVPNIDSGHQWADYFSRIMPQHALDKWPRTEKTGQLSTANETLQALAAGFRKTPLETFFDALSGYKTITKYLNSFGHSLIETSNASPDARIRCRFNIGAAKTCRFSSSGPNLQQIPRDKDLLGQATSVRRSFIAGRGKRLVSLDYSGIELRVLALLSGDEQLLADMLDGDVHSEVAAVIAGHKIDKKTKAGKAARSAAKGVSFGIIYGSGAGGLAVTMRTGIAKAQDYIDFWEARYPKAFAYRFKMMDEVEATRYIRAIDGGTLYMGKRPDLPKCANYPVQRAALSIMARAISRHKKTLDIQRGLGRHKKTRMLATIHDALIDDAATKDAQACLRLMEKDMIAGYSDIFPEAPVRNLVEGGIGPSWAELD